MMGNYELICSDIHRIMTSNGWKYPKDLTTNDLVEFAYSQHFTDKYVRYEDLVLDEKQLEIEDNTRKRGGRIGTFNEFSARWKDSDSRYNSYKDYKNGDVYERLAGYFIPSIPALKSNKDASFLPKTTASQKMNFGMKH